MKRSVVSRIVTALWGLWFIAALTGPATLHACPQHAALMHAGHASSHASMHGATAEHHPSQQKGVEHKCNCLSECCAVAALAPSTVKLPQSKVTVVHEQSQYTSDCEVSSARKEHAQPFPNGPPSRV